MQNENGFFYETAVPGRNARGLLLARLAALFGYLFFGAALTLLCLAMDALTFLFFLLPLCEALLVLLTWKYTKIEYEYSFAGETLSVSRIAGGRRRKLLFEGDLRRLDALLPYEEKYLSRAEGFGAGRAVYAVPDLSGEGLYLLLFQDEQERTLLCLSLDERALSIIRFYNRSAIAK